MTQTTENTKKATQTDLNVLLEQRRHRVTVAEFEKAYLAGVFGEKRLELIEGVIVEMPPMGDQHIDWLRVLNRRLTTALSADQAEVISQVPIRLVDDATQPEPDFVVVKPENYHQRKIMASEAAFVIEIGDATLEDDRTIKLRLYARNGVKEYWILSVKSQQLEVYRDPQDETYNTKFTLNRGQLVTPLEFPDVMLEWW